MKLNKYIFRAVIVCGCALSLASCEDKVDGESIFDTTEDTLDPASPTYQLDVYLEEASLITSRSVIKCRMWERIWIII